MRKYLLLAAAAAVVTTPAVARDRSAYVGIEGGPMIVEDSGLDFRDNDSNIEDAFELNHNTGVDVGLVGGYDWGGFRTEVELGYKRAGLDEVQIGFGLDENVSFDADGSTRVLSAMVNFLLDFGDENGWSGFAGPGIGLASVRQRALVDEPIGGGRGFGLRGEDRVFALQVIAGVRRALTQNIDLGLKYRFFDTSRFKYEDDGDSFGTRPINLRSDYRSHSLLASLIYNFYTPPPPPPPVYAPPPPPPPPATKTCPDGSVVLVTDPCPLPPPPPPPPPPLPERG